jgi:hypothetical protein
VHKMPERMAFAIAHGFRLWDVVDLMYRAGTLWQLDMIFVSDRAVADNPRLVPWAGGPTPLNDSWFGLTPEFQKVVRSWPDDPAETS